MPEFNFKLGIQEWTDVSVGQRWPEGAKDYGDVPYLVYLNDLFIDLSNDVDKDTHEIIGSLFVDLFHLLCMRDVVRTYKTLSICMQSIESDVKRQVLTQLRDYLVAGLDPEEDDIPEDRPQQQREKGYL